MPIYYHNTPLEKLASIQEEGLVPQANYRLEAYLKMNKELRAQTASSSFLFDVIFKPQTYFWKSKERAMGENTLAVDVPEGIRIERDYEQLIYFYLGMANSIKENINNFNQILSSYGSSQNVEGKSFEKDIRTIMSVIDSMSDEQWDKDFGAYRTSQKIDAKCIQVLEKS